MIELQCEVCEVNFQGTHKRPITICPECAGQLRKKGFGPVQLLGKPKEQLLKNHELKNTIIKRMKEALGK
jgi:hypothetical protein